jgi:hypothetical protein
MVYLHRIIMIDTWNYYIKWSGLFDGLVGGSRKPVFLLFLFFSHFSDILALFYCGNLILHCFPRQVQEVGELGRGNFLLKRE